MIFKYTSNWFVRAKQAKTHAQILITCEGCIGKPNNPRITMNSENNHKKITGINWNCKTGKLLFSG
jgi:hypothetical protein